jgi:hypothetical protein
VDFEGSSSPNTDAVDEPVKKWLSQTDSNFYRAGIQRLVERWRKCTESGGDFVEK